MAYDPSQVGIVIANPSAGAVSTPNAAVNATNCTPSCVYSTSQVPEPSNCCITHLVGGNTLGATSGVYSGVYQFFAGDFITASQNGQSVTWFGQSVAGAPVNFSAGTTSGNLGSVVFSNSNGVSFGLNGSTITASISVTGGGVGGIAASAAGNSVSDGTVVWSNANGVSFGMAGSTITASHNGLTSQSNQALSGSNGSFTFQTATFGNANGMSFLTSNGSMVGSYTVPTQSVQSINVSGGTTSNNLTNVVFSNSNNVTFGLNGSTITASASAASTQGSVNLSAGTTSNLASAFTLSNSNNVSFGLNAGTITASATVASTQGSINLSAGTTSNLASAFTFSNSNNVSFGLAGSTITASATVVSTQGSINLSAGTTSNLGSAFVFSNSNNVSFGLNGSTVTATITVPAQTNQQMTLFATGNTTQSSTGTTNASSVIFRGAGIASVGITGGSIVVSVPAGVPSPVNFSAGTTSGDLASVVFSDSNGISFGLDGSTITASHNGITAQSAQIVTAANGGYAFQTLSFSNAQGVSFATSAGSAIVASIATSLTAVNLSAGTTSNNLSAFVFSNSNNVSFGLNGSTVTATATVASTQGSINISAGTTSNIASAFTFSNSNGISFGLDGSTVTASHNGLTSQSNQAASAANGSFAFQTISFSNLNGISFGTSAGSAITASHNALTSQSNQALSADNGSFAFQTASFSNANGVSFLTAAGSAIQASIATSLTNIKVSAGTTSNNLSAITFSNSNGVSFGLNGSTLTASVGAAGADTLPYYMPWWGFGPRNTALGFQNRTMLVCPFDVPNYISASRINFYIGLSATLSAANSTGSGHVSFGYAIYSQGTGASTDRLMTHTSYGLIVLSETMNSNTQFVATHYIGLSNATSHSTTTVAISNANASTYNPTSLGGFRVLAMPLGSTLTPGRYWVATVGSTTQAGGVGITCNILGTQAGTIPDAQPFGVNSVASNASVFKAGFPGIGTYSVTTTGFPDELALTTNDIRAAATITLLHFDLKGYNIESNFI